MSIKSKNKGLITYGKNLLVLYRNLLTCLYRIYTVSP